MTSNLTTLLHAQGFRLTPQRLAILRILRETHGHMTPAEVYESAQQTIPGVTEATVYRTLNFLSDLGLVLETHVGNGQLMYELAEHAHHHLICKACRAQVEIDHAEIQALYNRIQTKTGFRIEGLHITFFGLCPDCQEKNPSP
jgi:Fe2+ or Zn2+ uptake regulation protein